MSASTGNPIYDKFAGMSSSSDKNIARLASEAAGEIGRLMRVLSEGSNRRLPVCDDHAKGALEWPDLSGGGCAACRIAYLEAQESLLQEWQDRAKAAEERAAEVERPLDAQMARLNARVVEQNDALRRSTVYVEALAAPARELLYLYDWRPTIAKMEKDELADTKEVKRLLREYGERKKAGWIALRAALANEQTGSAKAAGAPGAESTAAPTNALHPDVQDERGSSAAGSCETAARTQVTTPGEGADSRTEIGLADDLRPGDRVRYVDTFSADLNGRCGTVIKRGGNDGVWMVRVDDFPNPNLDQEGCYGAQRSWVEIIERAPLHGVGTAER